MRAENEASPVSSPGASAAANRDGVDLIDAPPGSNGGYGWAAGAGTGRTFMPRRSMMNA